MFDQDARADALHEAFALHKELGDLRGRPVTEAEDVVLHSAERYLAWLRGPTSLRLTAGPVRYQSTGLPSGTPTEGAPMQIHDDEEFDLGLHELDSKGIETDAGTLPTWTSSDETAVPVNVSVDGKTFHVVAGIPAPGVLVTASVTLADGTVRTISEVVDVVAGGVATINLVAGPVSLQPAPAPAPAPAAVPATAPDVPADPAPVADVPAAPVPAADVPAEAAPVDTPAAPDQPVDPTTSVA